jgi:IS30 family transposase
LRLGIETGLRAVCAETIYGWIYRAGQKADRLWRFLTRRHARRRQRHGRASRDAIAEKAHISQRSDDADARETVGHWEADLVICKRSRPVLVLHERKTRITLMSRLAGKTAAETVAAMMAAFRRLDPRMRGSVTFDNDTCFARHMLLRGMLSATTYFCDAYASWQKGGIENANGRIRRWLPRGTHDWEKFVTPEELGAAIEQGGLILGESSGVVYNPLSDRWSAGRDMDVNYMLAAHRGA